MHSSALGAIDLHRINFWAILVSLEFFIYFFYSRSKSLILVFDLVFSSTCLIITAQYKDGADGFFLSGNDARHYNRIRRDFSIIYFSSITIYYFGRLTDIHPHT